MRCIKIARNAPYTQRPPPHTHTKSSPPVTGPVARFARQIAGHGYIVAAPSSYHDFTGPEALAYDVPGTDLGNKWKIEKVCPSGTICLDAPANIQTDPQVI